MSRSPASRTTRNSASVPARERTQRKIARALAIIGPSANRREVERVVHLFDAFIQRAKTVKRSGERRSLNVWRRHCMG